MIACCGRYLNVVCVNLGSEFFPFGETDLTMSLLPPMEFSDPFCRRGSSGTESSASGSEACSISTTSSFPDDAEVSPSTSPGSVGIVGMACRLPGANNPSQLWDNIVQQKDLQRKIPCDRMNVDAFYHPEGANKGTVSLPPYV